MEETKNVHLNKKTWLIFFLKQFVRKKRKKTNRRRRILPATGVAGSRRLPAVPLPGAAAARLGGGAPPAPPAPALAGSREEKAR